MQGVKRGHSYDDLIDGTFACLTGDYSGLLSESATNSFNSLHVPLRSLVQGKAIVVNLSFVTTKLTS